MRYRTAVLILLLLATPSNVGWAQSYATQGIESYLRVEFQAGSGRRGPVVAGYVLNVTGYTADRVRLAIESVIAAPKSARFLKTVIRRWRRCMGPTMTPLRYTREALTSCPRRSTASSSGGRNANCGFSCRL